MHVKFLEHYQHVGFQLTVRHLWKKKLLALNINYNKLRVNFNKNYCFFGNFIFGYFLICLANVLLWIWIITHRILFRNLIASREWKWSRNQIM